MKNILDLLTIEEKKYIEYRNYNRNEIVFSEGILCKYIGILLEGQLIISTITYKNNEEIITIINKNQLFGNNLIFSTSPYFLGDIIAKNNSSIAFISKNNLMKIFNSNEKFLLKYLELISNQILIEKRNNKLLAHKNIRDRILYFFNQEIKEKGHVKIKSIADLARRLSLPRPSVSREIYKLINDGIIEYSNKYIFIK